MKRFLLVTLIAASSASLIPGCRQKQSPVKPALNPAQVAQRPMNMKDIVREEIAGIKSNPRLTAADKAYYIHQVEGQVGGGQKMAGKSQAKKKQPK